jgi:hypothetical protein
LTPIPPSQPEERQGADVARPTSAHSITVPTEKPAHALSGDGGDASPTGVADLTLFPTWADINNIPAWYSKGADVDELLDTAEALDWLLDSGDVNEIYQPSLHENEPAMMHVEIDNNAEANICTSTSVTTLPHVDSNVESIVPSLPDLFDGTHESTNSFQRLTKSVMSSSAIPISHSVASMGEHLQVLIDDSPMEEHDFVSTILESSNVDGDDDDLAGFV